MRLAGIIINMLYSAIFRSKILLLLVPILCYSYDLEIKLSDTHGSRPIKIACNAVDNKTNMEEDHKVLWQGREFGFEEQRKISSQVGGQALMPNVTIKSTDKHRCYILTP